MLVNVSMWPAPRLNCDLRKIAVNLVPFPRDLECKSDSKV